MEPQQNTTSNPLSQAVVSPEYDIPAAPSNNRKKTVFSLLGALVIVVIVVVVGAMYLAKSVSNNPDKLWPLALTNTAKGSNTVLNFLGVPSANGYDVSNTNKSQGGATLSNTVTGSVMGQSANLSRKMLIAGNTVTTDTIVSPVSNASTPDVYYRISGVKELTGIFKQNSNSSDFVTDANTVNNRWLLISHDSQGAQQANATMGNSLPVPQASFAAVAQKLSALNQQYLYGSDASSALFTARQNIGSEQLNNRAVYHYKFTFQESHFAQYISAVTAVLGVKSLNDSLLAQQLGLDNFTTGLLSVNGTTTADIWVDKGTRTISKIHIPVALGGDNYVETGIAYTGGPTYPLYVTVRGDADGTLNSDTYTLSVNTKTKSYAYSYSLSTKSAQGTQTSNVTATLTPRTTMYSANIPSHTDSYDTYAAALDNVLTALSSGVTGQSQ